MKRFLMVMACTLIWVAPSYAQTCTGDLSFGAAPLQVGALGAFSSNSHTFAVGAGVGNDLLFGRGAVELMSFSGVDASAHAISGTAGAQFKFEASSKEIAVCPIVQLVHVWGPNIDVDHSTTVFQVGASVGFVAAKTAQATIVPTLALSPDRRQLDVERGRSGRPGVRPGEQQQRQFGCQPAVWRRHHLQRPIFPGPDHHRAVRIQWRRGNGVLRSFRRKNLSE